MCKYQCMKFLHIISGCPQRRGNGTFLMFAMLLYNKKGTASPCFMEKAVPYKKEKHLTKYQVLSSACAIGGGDKRVRTADLLNAIDGRGSVRQGQALQKEKTLKCKGFLLICQFRTLYFSASCALEFLNRLRVCGADYSPISFTLR